MAKPFANKVITITGGARGMGFATANYLVERGATVSIPDILKKELEAAERNLKTEIPGAQVKASVVDVRRPEQVKKWIDETKKECGAIHGCLNGAGILGHFPRNIVEYADDEFDSVIDVNLKGVFNCLRAELGVIEKGGSIVNISSVGGFTGFPGLGAYVASKFGVRGLTRVAAHEVAGDGTRVNAVCPGAVDTDMTRNSALGSEQVLTPQLFKRFADPSEVAALIAFLLGDESRFITGSDYNIDAGLFA